MQENSKEGKGHKEGKEVREGAASVFPGGASSGNQGLSPQERVAEAADSCVSLTPLFPPVSLSRPLPPTLSEKQGKSLLR